VNPKRNVHVSPFLRLTHLVVRSSLLALLFFLLLAGLSASGALSPTPRVHAADSNRDGGREVHSTTLTRAARATITWSGAGGDARWSNPTNWEGDVVPGPFDIARFADNAADTTVDADFAGAVAGIVLDEGYASTLRLARALTVNGDVVVVGGTIATGAAPLTILGTANVRDGLLITPADSAMSVNTLDIRTPGVVRVGANGKLNITGDGTPLTGNGTLDAQTNQPNSVEYTGAATSDLMAAGPLAGYRALGLDTVGKIRARASSVHLTVRYPSVRPAASP
jgi:hypothetical protein